MSAAKTKEPLTLCEAQRVAESIVGATDWQHGEHGFCVCPGQSLHTHRDGEKDCFVRLDKVPTIHCVHQSCAASIEAANHALRRALAKRALNGAPYKPSALEREERARRAADREAHNRLRANARASRDEILRRWQWSEVDAWESSPLRLEGRAHDDWRLHLSLFPRDALVWVGNETDTGRPEHSRHFRRVTEWLLERKPPGNFTCASLFADGCSSRKNETATATPFLIVEGDAVDPLCALKGARKAARKAEDLPDDPANELSREDKERNRLACLAVIRWLREAVELRLVAIVDAANKSAHGWFEMPPASVVAELRTILPDLGCDAALFKPSQPARLAGVKRGCRWQRLLFCELPTWREAR